MDGKIPTPPCSLRPLPERVFQVLKFAAGEVIGNSDRCALSQQRINQVASYERSPSCHKYGAAFPQILYASPGFVASSQLKLTDSSCGYADRQYDDEKACLMA